MAQRYNYNKSTIQEFKRQLTIRQKAIHILKNKETALRSEVQKVDAQLEKEVSLYEEVRKKIEQVAALWTEFPRIVSISKIGLEQKRIVGVRVPVLHELKFDIADVSWWNYPAWIPFGVDVLQDSVKSSIKIDVLKEQKELLEIARKKTTQKVNLYEKVQIPAYEEAILKIKRYLEDKENITKAAHKIVKKRKKKVAA